MPRKPRQRIMPELDPDELFTGTPGSGRPTIHRLTGELNDTLEAIVSACAIADQMATLSVLDPDLPDAFGHIELPTLDELPGDGTRFEDEFDDEPQLSGEDLDTDTGELGEAFAGIALTKRVLARALLTRALNREPDTPSWLHPTATIEQPKETRLIEDVTKALLSANLPKSMRPTRIDRREALEEAASLIHEVGLEDFGVSCDLLDLPGNATLAEFPTSPEGTHIALLEYLFDRAEGVVEDLDPLLAVERDASFWEFSRWSVSPPAGEQLGLPNEFPRTVREQEYSLADRRTVTLGTSVIAELADDSGFAELFPRQHRMATALTQSFVDVFECMARDGSLVTLRSLTDDRTYQVREHVDPNRYRPGWIMVGRLLPFEDDTYLRSPGMLFVKHQSVEEARSVARLFDTLRASMTPSLAIEAFISNAMFGIAVPREVKPARSRSLARALLEMINDIIADAEADDDTSVSSDLYYVPSHHTESGALSPERIRLDSTIQAYMAALAQQATGGGQGRQQRARTPKRKGKRRR